MDMYMWILRLVRHCRTTLSFWESVSVFVSGWQRVSFAICRATMSLREGAVGLQMIPRYPCRNKCSFYGQRACLAHERLWEYVSNEKLTRQQCFLLIAALSFSSSFSISSFLSHFLSLSRNQSPVQAPPVFFDRFFDIFTRIPAK